MSTQGTNFFSLSGERKSGEQKEVKEQGTTHFNRAKNDTLSRLVTLRR